MGWLVMTCGLEHSYQNTLPLVRCFQGPSPFFNSFRGGKPWQALLSLQLKRYRAKVHAARSCLYDAILNALRPVGVDMCTFKRNLQMKTSKCGGISSINCIELIINSSIYAFSLNKKTMVEEGGNALKRCHHPLLVRSQSSEEYQPDVNDNASNQYTDTTRQSWKLE
jgi:hypothetical protein